MNESMLLIRPEKFMGAQAKSAKTKACPLLNIYQDKKN